MLTKESFHPFHSIFFLFDDLNLFACVCVCAHLCRCFCIWRAKMNPIFFERINTHINKNLGAEYQNWIQYIWHCAWRCACGWMWCTHTNVQQHSLNYSDIINGRHSFCYRFFSQKKKDIQKRFHSNRHAGEKHIRPNRFYLTPLPKSNEKRKPWTTCSNNIFLFFCFCNVKEKK